MLKFTTEWVKGEVMQGKMMIILGVLIAVASYFIWKSSDEFTRGLLIPLILVMLICLGYGANLFWGRPAKLNTLTTEFQNNSTGVIQAEKERLQKEAATYSMTTKAWAVLAVVGLLLYFFLSSAYYKGVGIGVLLFGLTALLTDIFLSRRVATYLEQIQNI